MDALLKRVETLDVGDPGGRRSLDLSEIPDGIVAITGTVGIGKTMLVESALPGSVWLRMPSRDPVKLPHVAVSRRSEMSSVWELDGVEYTFAHVLDGVSKLHKKATIRGPDGHHVKFNGLVADGKIGTFKEIRNHLFGGDSWDVVAASVFWVQKGGGAFTRLGQTKAKGILSRLLGAQRHAAVHDVVSRIIKDVRRDMATAEQGLDALVSRSKRERRRRLDECRTQRDLLRASRHRGRARSALSKTEAARPGSVSPEVLEQMRGDESRLKTALDAAREALIDDATRAELRTSTEARAQLETARGELSRLESTSSTTVSLDVLQQLWDDETRIDSELAGARGNLIDDARRAVMQASLKARSELTQSRSELARIEAARPKPVDPEVVEQMQRNLEQLHESVVIAKTRVIDDVARAKLRTSIEARAQLDLAHGELVRVVVPAHDIEGARWVMRSCQNILSGYQDKLKSAQSATIRVSVPCRGTGVYSSCHLLPSPPSVPAEPGSEALLQEALRDAEMGLAKAENGEREQVANKALADQNAPRLATLKARIEALESQLVNNDCDVLAAGDDAVRVIRYSEPQLRDLEARIEQIRTTGVEAAAEHELRLLEVQVRIDAFQVELVDDDCDLAAGDAAARVIRYSEPQLRDIRARLEEIRVANIKAAAAHEEALLDVRGRIEALESQLVNNDCDVLAAGDDAERVINYSEPQLRDIQERLRNVTVTDVAAAAAHQEAKQAFADTDRTVVQLAERLRSIQSFADTDVVDEYQAAKASIRTAQQELECVSTVRDAFHASGIPEALVKSAGPEVARRATEMLSAVIGHRRFVIDLEDGVHVIDQNLAIHHGTAERRSAANLSGGQEALVESAVRMAVAEVSASQGATTWRTVFADEMSSGLGAIAPAWVELLRESARRQGLRHLLLVSHDPRVIACADTKVVLGSDGLVRANDGIRRAG